MHMPIRFSVALGVVAVALALSVTTASAAYPPSATPPTVSTSTLGPGDCVTIEQKGLAPGADVTFVFSDANGVTTSQMSVVGTSGVVSVLLCIPVNAATGKAIVTLADVARVLGQVVVNVGAQDSDVDLAFTDVDLAFTGRSIGSTVGTAALAIVVGGVLVALSRRREVIIS